MMLAFHFGSGMMLIGLLAAAIPFLLHMMSSVKAQEVLFPTLRFLKTSMERTARRRKIQQWLLLAIRSGLLGLLAIGVAEPLSEATGGWLGGEQYAAAVILDNSMSMSAMNGGTSRLQLAKAEATTLLSGDQKPALAALLTTNGGPVQQELSDRLDTMREGLLKTEGGYGVAPLAQRFNAAVDMLSRQTIPQQSIYILSDLQDLSFENFKKLETAAKAKDIQVFVINTAGEKVNNVGITDVQVSGQRVVDSNVEIVATLVNSSGTSKTVEAALRINGQTVGQRVRKTLSAAGDAGATATVRFNHRFAKPGPANGEVYLDAADDLKEDNVRRFSIDIGGRVRALVVRGPTGTSRALDPAMMLQFALDPYGDKTTPWPIAPQTVEAEQLAEKDLLAADVAFFCDVPAFSEAQARAVEQFALNGGTAVFFVGPEVQAENYNQRFVQDIKTEGGLLPGRLAEPVGTVGPDAEAVGIDWVDAKHPYFEGFYENNADYLTVLVQRYYKLAASARPGRVLMKLKNGDPLLLVKQFGRGRVLLCCTTASPRWTNLPITGLFLPMMARISLLARQEFGHDNTYLAGTQVIIRPGRLSAGPEGSEELPEGAMVEIMLPEGPDGKGGTASVPIQKTAEGLIATYSDTALPGFYKWQVSGVGGKIAGAFAVNPNGQESQLRPMKSDVFKAIMANQGVSHVYAAANLGDAMAAAESQAQGRNWWDMALVAVMMLLVAEALVANRRKATEDILPAHAVPTMAS